MLALVPLEVAAGGFRFSPYDLDRIRVSGDSPVRSRDIGTLDSIGFEEGLGSLSFLLILSFFQCEAKEIYEYRLIDELDTVFELLSRPCLGSAKVFVNKCGSSLPRRIGTCL